MIIGPVSKKPIHIGCLVRIWYDLVNAQRECKGYARPGKLKLRDGLAV